MTRTRRRGRWATALCAATLTTALIPAAHADARSFGDRTLKQGHSGGDVRTLQRWLGELGIRTEVDGRIGPKTARQVRLYERREELKVDGRVSPAQARGMGKRVREVRATAAAAPPAADAVLGLTDGPKAVLSPDGRTALAPASAPQAVKDAIAAANRITRKPYRYGGGHAKIEDSGYDCSGAISYALHHAGLLKVPRDSSGFRTFGGAGKGEWITIHTHSGHAYIVIAGLRFDTSGRGEKGPRWRTESRSTNGFTARHPKGL
jgi:peptidoglycan hydrolase-like protein with peptidoglycan-binding domain